MNITPTTEETPTLRKDKLAKFNHVLNNIDTQKKVACMMAQETSPDQSRDGFKIAFLRCNSFEVELSVDCWIKYWDLRLSIFGEEKAFLPMTLEGAMEGSKKAVSSTYMKVAKSMTDPDGPAICLFDFREEKGDISNDDLFKAVYYNWHVCLSTELTQKKGVVAYFRCLKTCFDRRQSI